MVYSLSQIYSKEKEKLMTEQNSDYKELRMYKARENRALVSGQTKQRTSERIMCECGCVVTKASLSTHRKTPKHLKLKNKIEITSKE